jgi:hypothetical protein
MNCIKFKECQNAIYSQKCKSCGDEKINFESKPTSYEEIRKYAETENISGNLKVTLLGYIKHIKVLFGDAYHDRIGERIEGYLKAFKDMGIEYTLETKEIKKCPHGC